MASRWGRYVRLFGLLVACVVWAALPANAQTPATGVAGRWEGTLSAGPSKLRLVLNISKAADGLLLGSIVSVDQGGVRIPIDRFDVQGNAVHFELKAVNGKFDGTLSADQTHLTGTWNQGIPLPLEFIRTGEAKDVPTAAAPPPNAVTPLPIKFPAALEMQVSVAPVPFTSGGSTHLVYELRLANFTPAKLGMSRLQVLNGTAVVASFEGGDLNAMMMSPSTLASPDHRTIVFGTYAVVFMWVSLPAGAAVPNTLRHRITLMSGETVEGAPIAVSTAKPMVVGPPLRGSDWAAMNGPANDSGHRRAMITLDGKTRIAQRFAIDWLKFSADGTKIAEDDKDNKSYYGYGSEVLSVADGVVSAVKDGIAENVPGATSRAVTITTETVGGNHVGVDMGGGRFAFYMHLQPGSLRVKKGDKVQRGQVLGLLGNSGNSTGPHLHFEIVDANAGLESEGLPYLIDAFELQATPGAPWQPRKNELPMKGVHVRFPDKQ